MNRTEQKKRSLVISDIDGTLTYGGERIREEVIDAAGTFMKRGNLLALCTGRTLSGAREIHHRTASNAPSILFGGAVIYDFPSQRLLFKEVLDPSIGQVIQQILEFDSEISVAVSTLETNYVLRTNSLFTKKALAGDRNGVVTDTIPTEPLIKVLLSSSRPQVLEQMKRQCIPPGLFHAEFASRHFFEIVSASVSKGKAIKSLLSLIPDSSEMHIIGAGDAPTDLSMKESVDLFCVPSTAREEVLASADSIIPSAEEGGMVSVFQR